MNNIEKIQTIIDTSHVDAILFTSRYNKGYLAGLYSGSGYVLVTSDSSYVFVDSRYYEEIKRENKVSSIILANSSSDFFEFLNNYICENKVKQIGFEGDDLSYSKYKTFSSKIDCELCSMDFSALRRIKSTQEISNIKKACEIVDSAYEHILKFAKVGMSEKEIESELISQIIRLGGSKQSFDIIVASGSNGALPHAKASSKLIQSGDLVTIDFGAVYNHYCSDMTRTFAIDSNFDTKLKEIYDIVLEAQVTTIKSIKAGVTTGFLDSIARKIITNQGYGQYYNHNTGHGLGVMVHEYPDLSPNSNVVLKENMIITVEPGIYLPNLGGVRIEDDVLVTKDGFEILTKSDKNFHIIG